MPYNVLGRTISPENLFKAREKIIRNNNFFLRCEKKFSLPHLKISTEVCRLGLLTVGNQFFQFNSTYEEA